MYYKHPRIYHLDWSPNLQNDDRRHPDIYSELMGKEVVVTVKMDGENTTMYSDKIHARSLDSGYHESRSWVKNLHGQIKHNIPEGWRICGENMFAKHTIYYDDLKSYFLVFGIWDNDRCFSWDETVYWSEVFGLEMVDVAYRGCWEDIGAIKKLSREGTCFDLVGEEGYVVRTAEEFIHNFDDKFLKPVAKYVRKNHVQTDQNWMYQQIIPNKLRGNK